MSRNLIAAVQGWFTKLPMSKSERKKEINWDDCERLMGLVAPEPQLQVLIESLRRPHRSCDDCWYSCPKSEDGCCDQSQGDTCNCGADEHNARVDAALAIISSPLADQPKEQPKP